MVKDSQYLLFQRFVLTLTDTLASSLKMFGEYAAKVMDACWVAYKSVGMPYGESEIGLMRWLKEMGEIQRLRDEADEMEENLHFLAQLRARIKGDGER